MNATSRAALRRVIQEEGTQKKAAARLGVSQQYISDLLKNRRQPGTKILRRLGLRKVVSYEEVGK